MSKVSWILEIRIKRMDKMRRRTRLPDAINRSASKNFVEIPNDLLRNPNISFEAKAVYGVLLLNGNNENGEILINLNDLFEIYKEDRDVIRSAIDELEMNGYLEKYQI